MSGSLFWYDYSADNGTNYAVLVDKSNAIALCNALPLMIVRTANNAGIPKVIKMRYVNAYLSSNPLVRRRFWVGNKAAFTAAAASGATIVATEGTYVISSLRGEKTRQIPIFSAADTGQTV